MRAPPAGGQMIHPQPGYGGSGYAPLSGRGHTAGDKPPEAPLSGFEQLFFEPETVKRHVNWKFVGQGRGTHLQQDYRYVGEGAGSYNKDEIHAPQGRRLRQEFLCCCASTICAIVASLIVVAIIRSWSATGDSQDPTSLRPPNLQVSCKHISEWPDLDDQAPCGTCQQVVLMTHFQNCSAYCKSCGQQCFYSAPFGEGTGGSCQVQQVGCDVDMSPHPGNRMICGCQELPWEIIDVPPDDPPGDPPDDHPDDHPDKDEGKDGGDPPMTQAEREELCTEDGADCAETTCCKAEGSRCFRKDQYWSECLQSCKQGIHLSDEEQYRTPWACEDIDRSAVEQEGTSLWSHWHPAAHHASEAVEAPKHHVSSAVDVVSDLVDDAVEHSDSAADAAGDAAGRVPDEATHHASNSTDAVKDSVDRAVNATKSGADRVKGASDDAHEWATNKFGDDSTMEELSEDRTCAKKWENCKGIGCCEDEGLTCFEHGEYWAECLESCTPGIHESDAPQFQSPWSCRVLTPDSPGRLPSNYAQTTSQLTTTPFDCVPGGDNKVSRWSADQLKWCCKHKDVGCPLFDCATGSEASWNEDKKFFCCEEEQLGCDEVVDDGHLTQGNKPPREDKGGAESTTTTISDEAPATSPAE